MTEKKRVNSRTKGHSQERKLVKSFSNWWKSEFFRTPGSGSFATRGFTKASAADFAGDILTNDPSFPFCVESKKVEGWSLHHLLTSEKSLFNEWWEQTIRETPENKIPLLVFTKNRTPEFCVMKESDCHFVITTKLLRTSINDIPVCIFELKHLFATNTGNWKFRV